MNLQTNFNTKKQTKQEVSKQWMEEVQQLLPKNLDGTTEKAKKS